MIIFINDVEKEIPHNTLLETIINQEMGDKKGFAVAVNMQFIPKSSYATTVLQDHDHIDIVMPMQGG